MAWLLELSSPDQSRATVSLTGDRVTIGKLETNDIVLDGDVAVSRVHAVFERHGPVWYVRDLGSRNGTFVGEERVNGHRPLHDGDEIRVGATRISIRADRRFQPPSGPVARGSRADRALTDREHWVLRVLCRQVLSGDAFTEQASIRAIATELRVSDDEVAQHLSRLYERFEIPLEGERRRVRLANVALRRGAVNVDELEP